MKKILPLFFVSFCLMSQEPVALNKKIRTEVVHSVSRLLLRYYVYEDTAVKMSQYILKKNKDGAYDQIAGYPQLSSAITNDLYAVYHDSHLSVEYNPELERQLLDTSSQPQAEDPFAGIKRANFGLAKAEVLNGNIGYLGMNNFWADKTYGRQTVKAALKFLEYTNALIIDLRTNGGGSPETVTMICSYFFKDRIHMNDTYNRAENSTVEFWTEPDSTLAAYITKPIYVLTSDKTFSAAEEFAYNLKNLKRATIIGQVTGGGAHNTFEQAVGKGYIIRIPYGKAVNAVTKTNWEGTGVKPDIEVPANNALATAQFKVFESLLANAKNEDELFDLNWQLAFVKAQSEPVVIDEATLQTYAGVYGDRSFIFENGKLYYQRKGKPKFELEPMTKTIMKGKGNQYFKIEFMPDREGKVNDITVYYQTGIVEKAGRTK
jgi:hypothetical protein